MAEHDGKMRVVGRAHLRMGTRARRVARESQCGERARLLHVPWATVGAPVAIEGQGHSEGSEWA